jgi:hypothetical protein
MVVKEVGLMIFYQYDPECDQDILNPLVQQTNLSEPFPPQHLSDDNQIYIFADDEEMRGYLWLKVDLMRKTMFIKKVHTIDQVHPTTLEMKLYEFAIKKAKYLQLKEVIGTYTGNLDGTQLEGELGCNRMEWNGNKFSCYLT